MATSMVHGFALEYGVGLDYEDFSSMPYGVAYSNIVYGFAPSVAYDALPSDPVRVPPLGYIIWLSYPPALKYLLVR